MASCLKVAVIGAGFSGLLAARELQREAHRVVVFEKADRLGGTWAYDPMVEADLLGLDPYRDSVHSSLYHSLRTNVPRQVMGFSDYSFEVTENGDPRHFPGHEEVLRFLKDFADTFGLTELIRFKTEVVRVEMVDSTNNEYEVESRTSGPSSKEVFDAVVICNGHYTEPRVATDVVGIEKWSRKQLHSHNYRVPEPFRDQIVVLIGSNASAYDISRELATVAKEVHISSRRPTIQISKLDKYNNVWQHRKIEYVSEDGTVAFQDGFSITADIILHCTGYKYNYPFLRTNDIVSVEDNCVGPLYKHVFPPRLGPRLSFVGINQKALPRASELQSKWIARVLSGKVQLPPAEDMLADVKEHYRQLEEKRIPKHYTHSLNFEFGYIDWLAAQVGPPVEERIKDILGFIIKQLFSGRQGYRDAIDVHEFLSESI